MAKSTAAAEPPLQPRCQRCQVSRVKNQNEVKEEELNSVASDNRSHSNNWYLFGIYHGVWHYLDHLALCDQSLYTFHNPILTLKLAFFLHSEPKVYLPCVNEKYMKRIMEKS